MPPGFLVVFSEPGDNVSLEEFQDWYDNEHVPLRLNHLSSFLTGARFSASDSLQPSWLALYDIDDTSTFQHDSYTRLRANRSLREAELIQRLEVLDRRTYELFKDSGESALTSSFKATNPTQLIITHGIAITSNSNVDQVLDAWAKEMLQLVKGVESWVRTRVYKCIDSLKTGTKIGKDLDDQRVPQYLAVHEILTTSFADSPAFQTATSKVSQEVKVVEDRRWELYRAYPCVAQGNLTAPSS